ncbi:unnamed protein product [Rodentolepis nana]|uniref:C2H2-type domain-containing protein n=1 Tax=Rodentolepis nana TaxID=102285 RepID=A0A0R3T514_RODNA|nr:unnamed protein product [Rodentolepis nana]
MTSVAPPSPGVQACDDVSHKATMTCPTVVCGYQFTASSNLINHKRRKHPPTSHHSTTTSPPHPPASSPIRFPRGSITTICPSQSTSLHLSHFTLNSSTLSAPFPPSRTSVDATGTDIAMTHLSLLSTTPNFTHTTAALKIITPITNTNNSIHATSSNSTFIAIKSILQHQNHLYQHRNLNTCSQYSLLFHLQPIHLQFLQSIHMHHLTRVHRFRPSLPPSPTSTTTSISSFQTLKTSTPHFPTLSPLTLNTSTPPTPLPPCRLVDEINVAAVVLSNVYTQNANVWR